MTEPSERRVPEVAALVALLVSVGVTLALYGRAVTLPFYSDDLLQVPWATQAPLSALWRAVSPYGDYRPLHFLLWRLAATLAGGASPALLHGLNLAGHALAGALVGGLAARLWRGPARERTLLAGTTAALFAAFPFAFDAVLWVSSFSYGLTTALAVGALLAYLAACERRSTALHLLAVTLTLLAGFAYEGGVVTGALVAGAAWLLRERRPGWMAAHLGASLLLLALIARAATVPTRFFTGLHPAYGLVILLQSLAFPVAPLAGDSLVGMVALGATTLAALSYGLARAGLGRPLLLALGWALAWVTIPLLTQAFNWYRDPPRVFYPAAVGIAWLWGLALLALTARWAEKPAARAGLTLVLLAAILATPVKFLRGRMQLYAEAGALLWKVIDAAPADPAAPATSTPTLFVNLPGRITPGTRTYPLGYEGVIPLPPPTDADLLLQAHGRLAGRAAQRAWGPLLPALPYGLELAGPTLAVEDLRAAGMLVLTEYNADGAMTLRSPGAVEGVFPGVASPVARFGEAIELLAARCYRDAGGEMWLEARWRLAVLPPGAPTAFVHLRDAGGTVLAQADGDPLGGLYPFSAWLSDEVVRETRPFVTEQGQPVLTEEPGYAVVGIWDPQRGARWPAVDAAGEALSDGGFMLLCEP